ncbi:MAG: hypothetical protein ACLSW6_02330 [Faecalibacterium prausnitzii]|jgi:hypothetical protein
MAEFLDKKSLALLLYMEKHNGKMNQHEVCLISGEDFSHNGQNRYIQNLKGRGLIDERRKEYIPDGVGGFLPSEYIYSLPLAGEAYLQELRADRENQILQAALDLLVSIFGQKF